MAYIVEGTTGEIDFGAVGINEIAQNIRMIITTPVGSVPLNREFGIDTDVIDLPLPIAQQKLTQEIFQAIRKYEPRVRVTKITFKQTVDEMTNGILIPAVEFEVK